MTGGKVTVIDYGVGNLYSVQRALDYCGAKSVVVSGSPEDVLDAERLILPGVGAFSDGMAGLKQRGLIEPILRYAASGMPLMGICLGMQMLASQSEEFGRHEGLGLIPGRVVPIPQFRADGSVRKIPVIGWFDLVSRNRDYEKSSISGDDLSGGAVYLVHSFYFQTESDSDLVSSYDCEGVPIPAIVRRENVIGMQFHPEKSGEVGLRMIRTFLEGRSI